MPRYTAITVGASAPDEIMSLTSALLPVDVPDDYQYDPSHPERIHEILRMAAATIDVGARIVSPASVAVAILQGSVTTHSDVAASQALAEKNSTTQGSLKKDIFLKSHAIAYTAIAKFVGTTHLTELTQPAQAAAQGIMARLAVQRNPVKIVTALLAEATTATPLRLDDVQAAWHTVTHRDLSQHFTLDQWHSLCDRALHSMAMLGSPQDDQADLLPRFIRTVLPPGAVTELHRSMLLRWLQPEGATADHGTEPCACHIKTIPALFKVITKLHEHHPGSYPPGPPAQAQASAATGPTPQPMMTPRDIPAPRANRGALTAPSTQTCHRFNRGECRADAQTCRFAHVCSHCARRGKQFPHGEHECRNKQRESPPSNGRRPTNDRPSDGRRAHAAAATVSNVSTDGLDANAIALVQQFAESLQADATEPTTNSNSDEQINMATISPDEHVCTPTACHDDAGTGAHEAHDSVPFFDTLLAEVADIHSDADLIDLEIPPHSSVILVDSTMPEALASLIILHDPRTMSIIDVQSTPFPKGVPLLNCPAAIISSALMLPLHGTGQPWHVPHRAGMAMAPVVLSTISPHTRSVYNGPPAHRWINVPPCVIRSLQAKINSMTHTLAEVVPGSDANTAKQDNATAFGEPQPTTASNVPATAPIAPSVGNITPHWMTGSTEPRPRPTPPLNGTACSGTVSDPVNLPADAGATTLPNVALTTAPLDRPAIACSGIARGTTHWMPCTFEDVLVCPDHYCGCTDCCFSSEAPCDLSDQHVKLIGAHAIFETSTEMIHGLIEEVMEPDYDYLPDKPDHGFLLSVIVPSNDPIHRDLDGFEFRHILPIKCLHTVLRGANADIHPTMFRMQEPKIRPGQTRTIAEHERSSTLRNVQQQTIAMVYEAQRHDDLADPAHTAHTVAMMVASAPAHGPNPTDLVDSGASAHFSPFIEDFPNGFTSSETINLQKHHESEGTRRHPLPRRHHVPPRSPLCPNLDPSPPVRGSTPEKWVLVHRYDGPPPARHPVWC